jgi:diguanylate cyclase (GGDEF)-like protein
MSDANEAPGTPGPYGPLLEALPVGIALVDRSGVVRVCNRAARELLGCLAGEPLFREPSPAPELRELEGVFWGAVGDPTRNLDEDREFTVSTADGGCEVRVRLRRAVWPGQHGALLLVDDNERFKRAERALHAALGEAEQHALRDPLTGLFNRRHVEWLLPAEVKRAERHGVPLALLILDLDHFKAVNDRYGHPMGDRVLVDLASVLNRVLRVGDTCGRLGGEEFCVVMPHSDGPAALRAAGRLQRVVRALRFEEQPDLRVTVSIGISVTRPALPDLDPANEAALLVAEADRALYAAKHAGRDRAMLAEHG